MIWELQGLESYLHFNFVIGAPSQHEGIIELGPLLFKSHHIMIGPMYATPLTIICHCDEKYLKEEKVE
jgi:hypothetical protein